MSVHLQSSQKASLSTLIQIIQLQNLCFTDCRNNQDGILDYTIHGLILNCNWSDDDLGKN